MFIARPPDLDEIIKGLPPERAKDLLFPHLLRAADGLSKEYLHWDKLRHLKAPEGMTHEEWWLSLKMARFPMQRKISLTAPGGSHFSYAMPDELMRLLHHVDQHCSGEIAMDEVVTADAQARQHYLVNSLMEEAIRSSQLEGATTSRIVAKDLIRSGREPKDRSERMIVNNYRALQFMREEMEDSLSIPLLLELQRILTEGTLEEPSSAGRFQTPGDPRVVVVDRIDGEVLHTPPPAEELPSRMEALCQFANEDAAGDSFVHPVVRAILIHFWLAYDHPFEDGNGRTARALFYWSMRKQGYWLTEYLSISSILRKAPAQYQKSFLYTETDENDLTYFIIYQLQVIERAVKELHTYLRRKVAEVREMQSLIKGSQELNHRQLALLTDAISRADRVYTFTSHSRSHNVTHETARHDLYQLEKKGLLLRSRRGRRFVFIPVEDLAPKLKGLAAV